MMIVLPICSTDGGWACYRCQPIKTRFSPTCCRHRYVRKWSQRDQANPGVLVFGVCSSMVVKRVYHNRVPRKHIPSFQKAYPVVQQGSVASVHCSSDYEMLILHGRRQRSLNITNSDGSVLARVWHVKKLPSIGKHYSKWND